MCGYNIPRVEGMYKFRRYFTVTIVITLLSLANIVAPVFASMHLTETKNAQNFSVDKGSTLHSAQSKNGINSDNEDINTQKPENRFPEFPWFDLLTKGTSFDEVEKYGDFAIDDDSMELVIGVNKVYPGAYGELANIVSSVEGKVTNTVSIGQEVIALVADVPLKSISSLTEKAQTSGLTRYIEPRVKFQAQFVPNDQYWINQWGPQKIQADWAWNTTIGDPAIIVAVIDTGIDYNHPDLEDNYVPLGYDWVNNDNNPLDDFGHGTHCAGIIAAELNNSIGIAGVAQVKIMAEKGFNAYGTGWDDDLANAIIHAVNQGADILSNSWGGYFDSALIRDAVQYAFDNGVLVIAAAGNSNTNTKMYPAAYDEVIAVAATDQYDYKAGFSNWGTWIELAAPGVSIYSTMPTYHVTLNDWGYAMNYDYLSGTSMACPHVAGAAALVWSLYPNKTRDWVRLWLRYTTDDLGDPGFDVYYGYGRINARKNVEEPLPEHELIVSSWQTSPYVEPGATGTVNATILNFGENNETDVAVQLFANSTIVDSTSVSSIISGQTATANLSWSPVVEGVYNITLYVVPLVDETDVENNVVQKYIHVGFPLKAFVLHSAGNSLDEIITNWQVLNTEWDDFGDIMIYIDYTTLNKDDITYEDIVASDADVLIISCAYSQSLGWEFTNSEIEAIERYVEEGHGLIATAGTLYYLVANNNKLAPLFGLNDTIRWMTSGTDLLHIQTTTHPLFRNVPDPLVFPAVTSVTPEDGQWSSNELTRGEYLALGEFKESAIVAYKGLVYISPWLEVLPPYYRHHLQLLYNAIIWSQFQKPEHDLEVILEASEYLEPGKSIVLNATVFNMGLNSEADVEFQLLIDDTVVKSEIIHELENDTSYTMNYTWTPDVEKIYNVTAYAPPVVGENVTLNNIDTIFVSVHRPLINPIEGQYANYILNDYDSSGNLIGTGYWNFTYEHYVEQYKINVTIKFKDPYGYIYETWMIVNTMNRFVEDGTWKGLWYPGWIETDIDIGSTINLLSGIATVTGSKMMVIGPRAIDCWELEYQEYGYTYLLRYDKASGLWISMGSADPYYADLDMLLLVDTNIPIGTQYEHDLGVTLDTPRYLEPEETSLLNSTVYNIGLNNETNVEIQLLTNGTLVANATLSELLNGTSYTLNYAWTPTEEGFYNITAYAPSMLSEDVTLNNIVTRIVFVRPVEFALISDYSELFVVAPILDSIKIGYEIYTYNSVYRYTENLTLLLNYKAVILYKGSRFITSTEYSTLQSYLAYDWRLANLVRSSTTGDNLGEDDLIVTYATHPIMNGPYGSFPARYHIYGLFSDCDTAQADNTRNAVTVAELADGYDKIIATEGIPGKVVFWNGMGTDDWSWNSDCKVMFKNLVHWFRIRYEHELVVSLEAPDYLEPGSSIMLNATVQNKGLNNETNVRLQLLINGTIVENVTIPMLRILESYTISHLWTPVLGGTYNITVYAPPVSSETSILNNVYSKLVLIQFKPRILAYVQYADYPEYANIVLIIESVFGSNYILTEMWNYALLDSMLPGNDILLIPEQEYTGFDMMEMIGATWSRTLSEFLENGGIIIICDYNGGSGGTYGILTGAGLMLISGVNERTGYTLYVIDPTDPLAEGVSSTFTGPYGTLSFVTEEENVVFDDGAYPVAIHKQIDLGHIVLLGFDFDLYNLETERLMVNALKFATHITISIDPSGGSPGTEVALRGTKAKANGAVAIYWNDMFLGSTTADSIGKFTYMLVVPFDATAGTHEITIIDTLTGRIASTLFNVIIIALNPNEGPIGTKVTINGTGFPLESQVTITFDDMLIGYARVDSLGNFTFTFNIPLSSPQSHIVKALDTEGNIAWATFTIIDVTPLDVEIDVGAIHFIGEIVEFYAQITFKGQAINPTVISAVLYKPNDTTENLIAQSIATGLYKIAYTILGDETGTYTLVITASYVTDAIRADGTSLKSFLVSDTLTLMNRQIVEIKDGVALVQMDLGFLRLNLTAMNVTLADIFLKVIAINGTIATIQTTLGIMTGTVTGTIAGDIATIVVPGVGQIETDISSLKGTQETWPIQQYMTLIIALIAAASSTLSLIFLIRRRKTTVAKYH